jgi:hypothetical protein
MRMLHVHPMVTKTSTRPEDVYTAMTRLLGEELPVEGMPLPHVQGGVTKNMVCKNCKSIGAMEHVSSDGWSHTVCTVCASVGDRLIDDSNPYRTFDDEKDRRHFESITRGNKDNDDVFQIAKPFGIDISCAKSANERLMLHARAGKEFAAAVASLIISKMDYDPTLGLLTARPEPKANFACGHCSTMHFSMKCARFCCRGMPYTKMFVEPQCVRVRKTR